MARVIFFQITRFFGQVLLSKSQHVYNRAIRGIFVKREALTCERSILIFETDPLASFVEAHSRNGIIYQPHPPRGLNVLEKNTANNFIAQSLRKRIRTTASFCSSRLHPRLPLHNWGKDAARVFFFSFRLLQDSRDSHLCPLFRIGWPGGCCCGFGLAIDRDPN